MEHRRLFSVTDTDVFRHAKEKCVYSPMKAPSRTKSSWKLRINKPKKISFLVLMFSMMAPDIFTCWDTAVCRALPAAQLHGHTSRGWAQKTVGGDKFHHGWSFKTTASPLKKANTRNLSIKDDSFIAYQVFVA